VAGYGFASDRVTGRAILSQEWVVPVEAMLRIEAYRWTDTEDAWISGEFENTLAALLFGTDRFDYYQRDGLAAGASLKLGPRWSLDLVFRRETHAAVPVEADWSLFDSGSFRANRTAAAGEVGSLGGVARWSNTDDDRAPTAGWSAVLAFESATTGLGGDLEWGRALIEVQWFRPVGLFNRVRVLARAGSGGADGLPPQRAFALGGAGTLPGLGHFERGGDRLLYLHADYQFGAMLMARFDSPALQSLRFWVFADGGDAWTAPAGTGLLRRLDPGSADLASDVGVGLSDHLQILRLDLARRLDHGDAPWIVQFRVRWPFS
jgi:outer membrane protein assembly factor BamA